MSFTECKYTPVYDELNKLIFEYMELNGLKKTLRTFTSECHSKSLPCPELGNEPEAKAAFSNYDANKMMKAFDDGDLDGFIKLWKSFQYYIQVTSDDMAKLEVYIRVHFALWPRAHDKPREAQEKAMADLKQFFEEHKSCLGKDSAILPLYALPYVDDPFNHPIFKELFRDLWTMKLRTQLESTVQKYFELLQENICQHSRLAELIVKGEKYEEENSCKKSDHTSEYHQDRFYQLLGNHRKIRKLLQGTRESYAKLLLVTHELVTALQQSISGDKVPMDTVLDKCFYIFPEIFMPKDAADSDKPSVEYFKQISASANFDPTQDSEVSLFFLGISDVSPEFLDYDKIKDVLVTGTTASVTDKLCLLQAIRWLITRTNEKSRQLAIEAFVHNDLFGISSTQTEFKQKLLQCLTYPTPTYQKECLARLVNAISSTKSGRNYLASTNFLVDTLVKSLTTFTGPTDSFICQMVVASMQKLSLKRSIRLFSIKHNVITWLVIFIKSEMGQDSANNGKSPGEETEGTSSPNQNDNFNPYLMEYAWALLMNLCLHEEAWGSCVDSGKEILNVACTMLLTTPMYNLTPYVVSTLYSLLRCPEMYVLAKNMELQSKLAPLLVSNTELSEHLNNLISLLNMKGCDRITSSRETNYDDEDSPDPDVFEPEIELTESWTASLDDSDLTGDNLLLRQYLISKADPVVPLPQSVKQQNVKKDPKSSGLIMRPVTPSNPSVKTKPRKPVNAQPIASYGIDDHGPRKESVRLVSKPLVPTTAKTGLRDDKKECSVVTGINGPQKFATADRKVSKTSSIASAANGANTKHSSITQTKKKSTLSKEKEDCLNKNEAVDPYCKVFGANVKGKEKVGRNVGEGETATTGTMDPGLPIQFRNT